MNYHIQPIGTPFFGVAVQDADGKQVMAFPAEADVAARPVLTVQSMLTTYEVEGPAALSLVSAYRKARAFAADLERCGPRRHLALRRAEAQGGRADGAGV